MRGQVCDGVVPAASTVLIVDQQEVEQPSSIAEQEEFETVEDLLFDSWSLHQGRDLMERHAAWVAQDACAFDLYPLNLGHEALVLLVVQSLLPTVWERQWG